MSMNLFLSAPQRAYKWQNLGVHDDNFAFSFLGVLPVNVSFKKLLIEKMFPVDSMFRY